MISYLMKNKNLLVLLFIIIIIVLFGIHYINTTLEFYLIPYRFNQVLSGDITNYFDYYLNDKVDILNAFNEQFQVVIDNVEETVKDVVSGEGKTFKEMFYSFCHWFIDFQFNFILYGINIGLNVVLILYLMYMMYIDDEVKKYTFSYPAIWFKLIINKIVDIFMLVKKGINYIVSLISRYKKIIISVSLVCFYPFFTRLILEVIIFIITYFMSLFNFTFISLLGNILKFIVVLLFPLFLKIPFWVKLVIGFVCYVLIALGRAEKKLVSNYDHIKCFVKYDTAQCNLLNGPPGVGKTRLNVYLTTVAAENFQEELESILLQYHIDYPFYNFSALEFRIYNALATEEDMDRFSGYIETFQYLHFRTSYILSNFPILDPYVIDYSKILKNTDLEFNNRDKYVKSCLSKYTCISITEFDKYANSHDKSKDYFLNGVNAFFSLISHVVERKTKIFCDYQLKDQVPKMLRGNAEKQFKIEESIYKLPLMLRPINFILSIICDFFNGIIDKYTWKQNRLYKRSHRMSRKLRKRNDYTLLIMIVRMLANFFGRINDYINSYHYTVMYLKELEDEGHVVGECKIYINGVDEEFEGSRLYNSVNCQNIYSATCEYEELEKWTSLTPSEEEIRKCGMFNKMLGKSVNEEYLEEENEEYIPSI